MNDDNDNQNPPLSTNNPLANIPANPSWLNVQQSAPTDNTPLPQNPVPTFPQTSNIPQEINQSSLAAVLNPISTNPANPPTTSIAPNLNGNSTEPAPTDLSQLTGGNDLPPPPEIYTPTVSNTENLVVPTPPATGIPESIKTNPGHSGLSKFFIIGGVLILLVVMALSAYFILGIGKPNSTPLPIPSTDIKQPTAAPIQTPQSSASSSGDFGDLNGTIATSSASPTSAIERLRQRQSASPTP